MKIYVLGCGISRRTHIECRAGGEEWKAGWPGQGLTERAGKTEVVTAS